MGWIIWGGILPVCMLALWLLGRRPVRQVVEDIHFDQARILFRQQREWLEARFLSALARNDPLEGLRWEEAHWHDEIVWARERPSRRLLALVGVHFDADPIYDQPEHPPRHATALFEYHKGRWIAEGKRLDQTQPDEAFLRHHRLEPVVPHQRKV
ncbi:MAG TPA: hypothetical protein VGZ22_07635 [Isosphaeraceae bacterium]|nr:hypothetical protein [Isosphaeraceae bacterium]